MMKNKNIKINNNNNNNSFHLLKLQSIIPLPKSNPVDSIT